MGDRDGERGAVETLLGTGLEEPDDPVLEALRTIAELREALKRGDADAVRPKLDLLAYGAGQRGVLSTLAATRSVEEAVQRLAPFWRTAEYRMDAARVVAPDEVEVYETVIASGASTRLRTLTLLRSRGGHWRQVTTMDAPDEKLVLALICDDEEAPLTLASEEAILEPTKLRHPGEPWEAVVRTAPPPEASEVPDRRLREALVGAKRIVSFALLPPTDIAPREAALRWLGDAVAAIGEGVGARQVYLPWNERLLHPEQLVVGPDATRDDLAARWVNVIESDGWTGTRGMSHFMLPEVEARWMDWPDEDIATQIVVRAAEDLRDGECELKARTDQEVAGTRCRADYGRRGAVLGQTYGRYGSVRLAPSRV
ncbi:MAG: hypothetical protein H6719_25010 [Sandaracinaceae bacterium]|nr:hypothetical protein [Sandaracinaceae bacterium]